jgi:hypothetical protein
MFIDAVSSIENFGFAQNSIYIGRLIYKAVAWDATHH